MVPFIAGLLSSGLRLIANAALVKGKDFIKEKTGVDLEAGALSEEDTQKLRQFQAEHEEELLRMQLENNKLDLEEAKAYLADVQDARKNQTMVQMDANAPWYVKGVQPTLAATVVIATIIVFVLFVYLSGDAGIDAQGKPLSKINDTQKDIIIYILGVLSAALTQVLGYYFGSSQGSANKSKALDAAILQRSSGGDNK